MSRNTSTDFHYDSGFVHCYRNESEPLITFEIHPPRRCFVLLEYPVAQANQAFINRIERQSKLQKNLSAIKDTEAFKELEEMVAEFTGA